MIQTVSLNLADTRPLSSQANPGIKTDSNRASYFNPQLKNINFGSFSTTQSGVRHKSTVIQFQSNNTKLQTHGNMKEL